MSDTWDRPYSRQKAAFPFEITKIEKPSNTIISYAFLKPDEIISTSDAESVAKQTFEFTDETKKILGYNCKKAVTKINSNTIEIWYTNDLKIKGGPSSLGQSLGFVLEIERNKNSLLSASSIKKIKKTDIDKILSSPVTSTDQLGYKDMLWKSRFTTLKVFENETIIGIDPFATIAYGGIKLKVHPNDEVTVKEILKKLNEDDYLKIV